MASVMSKDAFAFVGITASIDGLKEIVKQSLEIAEGVEHMAQSIGASTTTIQTLSMLLRGFGHGGT